MYPLPYKFKCCPGRKSAYILDFGGPLPMYFNDIKSYLANGLKVESRQDNQKWILEVQIVGEYPRFTCYRDGDEKGPYEAKYTTALRKAYERAGMEFPKGTNGKLIFGIEAPYGGQRIIQKYFHLITCVDPSDEEEEDEEEEEDDEETANVDQTEFADEDEEEDDDEEMEKEE